MVTVCGGRVIVGLIAALVAFPASPAIPAPAVDTLEATAPTQRRSGSDARRTSQGFPSEYRQIQSRAAITRAELAVVMSVRLESLLGRAAQDRVVILTDTRDHWADRWIQTVARAGVMRPTPRHQFEPDQFLQRRYLAEAVSAVVHLAAERDPARTPRGRNRKPMFVDMDPTHINYQAAATAVSAGVLDVGRGGVFRPTALVNGVEAVDVVRRLQRLVPR